MMEDKDNDCEVRLNAIAGLLGAEGFSDHAANQIKRYWHRRVEKASVYNRNEKTKNAFGEVCSKLSEGEKLILGKYISILTKQSFDTGLRMGLMTLVRSIADEMD